MPGPYLIKDSALLESLSKTNADAVIPDSDKAYGVQCVGLVKVYAGTGATSTWTAGHRVMDSPAIPPGTAIATFNDQGKYASKASGNHACFFVRFEKSGFTVLEQHVKPNPNKIQQRNILARGLTSDVDPSNNADAYSIIL